MAKFRCLYGVHDDLHDFTEHALSTLPLGGLNARADMGAHYGPVHAAVLHREGIYQIELVVVQPDFQIPTHTHIGTDSIEYSLFGGVRFEVGGEKLFDNMDDQRFMHFVRGKGLRIANDMPHGGRSLSGLGAMFLSFQRWTTPMTPLGDNYQGVTMSDEHQQRCGP